MSARRSPHEVPLLPLLLLLLLSSSPPSSTAAHSPTPPLLSLLVPWTADGGVPAAATGALESLGEAPYLSSPTDERRLQAFLENDRLQGLRMAGQGTPDDWESPKSPDLFLLTEVGGEGQEEDGRRRTGAATDAQESHRAQEEGEEVVPVVSRLRRNGGFVSGSRMRTGGSGGGYAGSAGMMRVGGGFGGRGPSSGGRMSDGPSLSIVNPLDVLRQRLLLEIARRRMRESEDQIHANRELLKSIGKREATAGGATPTPRTPSSV